MDPLQTDATSDSSTEPAAGAETVPESVTSGQGEIPAQNLQGEFNRKFGKLQEQLNSLTQLIALQQAQAQPQPMAQPAQGGVLSDEQLWEQAKQGDRGAFEEYQRRIAQREVQGTLAQQNVVSMVDRQLGALFNRYPVLRDPSHPLAQASNAAYVTLVNNGYPQNRATALEAAKLAIADNPEIVAQTFSAGTLASDQARRSATSVARSGVTGATYRQQAPSNTKTPPVSKEEAALAARMGVKDPAAAKARFLKRNEEGKSSLGAVASFVNPEELG